jgi:nitronate monooxygenase
VSRAETAPVETALTRRLGLRLPIFQAPMAGATTPELAAAVSEAGGLGALGAGYLAPDALRQQVAAVQALTDRPFQVNLFTPGGGPPEDPDVTAIPDRAAAERANAALAPVRDELGLEPPALPARVGADFEGQVQALQEAGVPVVSFAFGIPDTAVLRRFKDAGALVMGTATTLSEAVLWQHTGRVDAVIAQGSEAGGHRGTFTVPYDQGLVGLTPLLAELRQTLELPFVAAGGIMTGAGIAGALTQGAAAAQLGTAFLTADECGASDAWKLALKAARDDGTQVTRAFSGKPARGLRNRFLLELAEAPVAPYPVQNALTQDIRAAATRQGRPEFQSMWAGQGASLCRRLPAGELTAALAAELAAARG